MRMRPRFSRRRSDLQASFWFMATCMALVGPVLMLVVVEIDRAAGPAGVFQSLVISPASARTILGSIGGSLITIASLTSSLTIVTLQLLSNQYTPRTIRGFLRSRLSQIVFGSFIGIFVYCLLMLVTIRAPGEANEPFVPSLGIVVAIALALGGLGLLVLFIHHMAQTIQVSTMAARIARRTAEAIDEVHPDRYDRTPEPPAPDLPAAGTHAAMPVPVLPRAPGYVRRLDRRSLIEHVRRWDLQVEVLARPGDFVTSGTRVMTVRAADGAPTRVVEAARGSLLVGHERDIDHDPGFGIRQLVDIALRALSPGVNDPSTAVTCTHYLQNIFEILSARCISECTAWSEGSSTLLVHQQSYEEYVDVLSEIGRYATGDVRVAGALLNALTCSAEAARRVGADERAQHLTDLAQDLAAPVFADARTTHEREVLASGMEIEIARRQMP